MFKLIQIVYLIKNFIKYLSILFYFQGHWYWLISKLWSLIYLQNNLLLRGTRFTLSYIELHFVVPNNLLFLVNMNHGYIIVLQYNLSNCHLCGPVKYYIKEILDNHT